MLSIAESPGWQRSVEHNVVANNGMIFHRRTYELMQIGSYTQDQTKHETALDAASSRGQ